MDETGRTIRIALVGAGKIVRDQHLPAIAGSRRFDLAAVVDPRGGPDAVPLFSTVEALLAEGPAVDAVAICTPPQARAAAARAAIAAGRHVLLEKPPAATLGELTDLIERARAAGVTLFAAWHSRFAPMVGTARDWLAGRRVVGGDIRWREDVRRWHPGQAWLWAPGGLGVFDPGINAFSILTTLLGPAIAVTAARLEIPANAHTPIAARLALAIGGAAIAADFDFRQQGVQEWTIALTTQDGAILRLHDGGTSLAIDAGEPRRATAREYPALYARFAELIDAGLSDADGSPLRLVADALLIAEHRQIEAFVP